ncbi:MAG: tail fiber protein [Pseudomonadota bacterium]|nr:MAG: phage tail protein [Pseudomonadota bacterium]
MSEPFLAEIRIFAGNFAPKGWAICNGALLPIKQNTGLFSLLGTNYGGDGKTVFALPNLLGRAPMHRGAGPGLTPRELGEAVGASKVTLLTTEIPEHTHGVTALKGTTPLDDPTGNKLGSEASLYVYPGATPVWLSPNAIGFAGNSAPHNNMQPYLALTFIIALQGVFPPRG